MRLWANTSEPIRTPLRLDKLGVTGSSPVPPTSETLVTAGFFVSPAAVPSLAREAWSRNGHAPPTMPEFRLVHGNLKGLPRGFGGVPALVDAYLDAQFCCCPGAELQARTRLFQFRSCSGKTAAGRRTKTRFGKRNFMRRTGMEAAVALRARCARTEIVTHVGLARRVASSSLRRRSR
jgi:hypothetical protein